jgi:hypothetical protein
MTDRDFARLTAIARRNGASDDAPDIAQDAIAWFIARPRPLTQIQAERPFDVLARRTQTLALNFRKRHARNRPQVSDIRVTYPCRIERAETLTARRAVLARLTEAERALILAPRGTVTASERVKRQRLLCKIRASVK